MGVAGEGDGPVDERSNLERLDDLQASRPFPYNLVVGFLVGLVLLVFGFHVIVVGLYAVCYAAVRWFLWQDDRILRRQYEARAERWADRRRRHG